MGRKVISPTPYAADGKRLRAARLALGYEVLEQYANDAGIRSNNYSQHETGVRRISLATAKALKRRFRLSLDFIYDGDPHSLPHGLANKINENLPRD